ncbi:hypothetical protein PVK06_004584 [Gossypium arboreum]|uniref:Uncharacterized protein n=1 Tax=Gossypium arboreum TaxID=29729 RepID=A0ABR0QSE9_GOSAR|nr:hypothetical protein PVK06_004584 [Gossypium arboreum]
MPTYAKFLKELLTNKRKLEDLSTVELNEECSTILQNKLPTKLKDPGSFTIPCLIGSFNVDKALADLSVSINLMPYKMFKQIGLGEPKPTRMSIQLADRSVKYPRGIIEDILVKVDKLIFPIDFVVLDMDEDVEVPLILGRPFLATARAIIDVGDGKMVLRVGDEEIVFKIYDAMRFSREQDDSCYFIDSINHAAQDSFQEIIRKDTLELYHVEGEEIDDDDSETGKIKAKLNFNESSQRQVEYEDIKGNDDFKQKPSIEEPPKLELKQLPNHLEYAFLGNNSTLPVIIASNLQPKEKEELIQVLKEHKKAIAWKIYDIKGISPSFCTHKILMKDEYEPCVQNQR